MTNNYDRHTRGMPGPIRAKGSTFRPHRVSRQSRAARRPYYPGPGWSTRGSDPGIAPPRLLGVLVPPAHTAAGSPFWRARPCCRRLDGDVLVGERRAGRGHFSGDRAGLEAFDDQPDAQRELPSSHRDDRECGESGLVGYRAMDDGGAVALAGEAQSVEPGGPSGIEVPLEADFVPSRL